MAGAQPAENSPLSSRRIQAMEEGVGGRSTTPHSRGSTDPRRSSGPMQQILLAAGAGDAVDISKYAESDVQSARDVDDLSPLHIAVRSGHHDVVKALLKLGFGGATHNRADQFPCFDFLHARTRKGYTAVHLAVASGDEKSLKLLIEKYDVIPKRPDREWDFADQYWMTPLHYAVLGNQKAVMRQLLQWPEYNRHVNARDYFQRTPLHLAAYHRPVPVDCLLQHPAVDLNAKDCLALTPLHWAVYFGRTDVVRCLVELPPDSLKQRTVHAVCRDIGDRSVLEIAMEDRLLDLIPLVLDNLPSAPFEHDEWFLRKEAATIHREVNFEMEKLLLTRPDVRVEKEDLDKNLGIYVNAINAILLVAALIAGAAISMSTDYLDSDSFEGLARESNFLRVFFFLKLISFYGSVATVLAGATILQPLGKSVPIARRVKYARSSLSITSMMMGFSLCFFLAAFYAQIATRVGKDEPVTELHIPYHIVSAVAIVLCFALVLYFIRLRQHMRYVLSRMEFKQERIKIWWESFWVVRVLSLLFFLEKLCFKKLKIADRVIERYAESYGRTGKRSQIFDQASKLYCGYSEYKRSQSQGEVQKSSLSFTELQGPIEDAYRRAWKSTTENVGLGRIGPAHKLSFADKYWRRHRVSSSDKELFRRIGKEILEMEMAYTSLTKRRGQTGRHFACYLDLLPHGLFFWIDDWVKLWREKSAILYCGLMLDKDVNVLERIQKDVQTVL